MIMIIAQGHLGAAVCENCIIFLSQDSIRWGDRWGDPHRPFASCNSNCRAICQADQKP